MTTRDDAVCARDVNVIVEASAGTGKTRLIVDRIVDLVAPGDSQRVAIPIERVAAITFTRKAAGELRVRTRHQLLRELAPLAPVHPRAHRLRAALAGVDTAVIGTIHGFADRVLRKWPAQAGLEPGYELAEHDDRLTSACYELLLHGVETGRLGDLVAAVPAARVQEAIETVQLARRAGLRTRSFDADFFTYHGLDGVIADMVLHRDRGLAEPPLAEFARATFDRYADEYVALVAGVSTAHRGGRWLVHGGDVLRRLGGESDPATLFREVVARFERGPRGRASSKPRRAHEFDGDSQAWEVWKAFDGDERRNRVRDTPLRDDLLAPLRRWLAVRLVRLRPVVLALYDQVKARERAVDHVDLLLRLRDLLRDDCAVRCAAQALFDHVLVDELQDTDPLQAEILMFLCERGAAASRWDEARLAPGTLTIVGDPKQSIYRFRRADVVTYRRIVEIVQRSPHLALRLDECQRSVPELVTALNARFPAILGATFPAAGSVRPARGAPAIYAVRFELPDGGGADAYRELEATTIARYLRALVANPDATVVDRWTGQPRRIEFGDIAVLAITTTKLPLLFAALDADDVPFAARGGSVFLADDVHRRFLLALCALADRDDGVAVAALLRPPFFALDLADLARARADDPADRATRARAIVRELRRHRFDRSPGATARALLEETGLARTLALGPNARQRVANLRELCFQLELRATELRLDFDGIVARVRAWIDDPVQLDPPHPVGAQAIRVLTVHQAKGLEFPVVVLWDGRASWEEQVRYPAWIADGEGRAWSMRLDQLRWDEPAEHTLFGAEQQERRAERRRVVYVAATRARDLLVIPQAGERDRRWICGALLGDAAASEVIEEPVHAPDRPAPWFVAAAPVATGAPEIASSDGDELATWREHARSAGDPVMRPVAVRVATPRPWTAPARFGRRFGATVHAAVGLALRDRLSVAEALRRARLETGLDRNLPDAEGDVARTLAAVGALGLEDLRVEYPLAGDVAGGCLAAGYADLVGVADGEICVLELKTDQPPAPGALPDAGYVQQLAGYRDLLVQGLGVDRARAGLLYTADGGVRWLTEEIEAACRAEASP